MNNQLRVQDGDYDSCAATWDQQLLTRVDRVVFDIVRPDIEGDGQVLVAVLDRQPGQQPHGLLFHVPIKENLVFRLEPDQIKALH